MKNRDIIIIAQQAWDEGIGCNAHNIAAEFALNNKVLYVNPPLDINTLLQSWQSPKIKKRIKGILGVREKLEQVNSNLWVFTPGILCLSINWLNSQKLFASLNKFNNHIFARSIRNTAHKLGMLNFVLFNDSLMFLGLEQKELLKPEKYIYYVRDYLIVQDYFKKHGIWAEAKLMETADLVVANSLFLKDYAAKYNPNAYDIGQGCELELFDPTTTLPIPDDLAAISKPIIGYVGNLTSERLDIDLLIKLAIAKPTWSFVMVGFEDKAFSKSKLHQLPNVCFLGPKSPKELSSYVQYFDVCINPQLVNELTIGNYPRKVDEYLAMGKPVVATLTEAMKMFKDYVYLGSTFADYLKLLEVAVTENKGIRANERISFAKSHSWKASVETLYFYNKKTKTEVV